MSHNDSLWKGNFSLKWKPWIVNINSSYLDWTVGSTDVLTFGVMFDFVMDLVLDLVLNVEVLQEKFPCLLNFLFSICTHVH